MLGFEPSPLTFQLEGEEQATEASCSPGPWYPAGVPPGPTWGSRAERKVVSQTESTRWGVSSPPSCPWCQTSHSLLQRAQGEGRAVKVVAAERRPATLMWRGRGDADSHPDSGSQLTGG